MSMFLILDFTGAIENVANSFQRGHVGLNNRRIYWISWVKLLVHKIHGGMRFKEPIDFNLFLLGKQGRNLQLKPYSLVSHLFKGRYYPRCNFLASSLSHNPSYVWRSIFNAKFIGGARTCWCIGSRTNILILGEPWVPNGMSILTNSQSVFYLRKCNGGKPHWRSKQRHRRLNYENTFPSTSHRR